MWQLGNKETKAKQTNKHNEEKWEKEKIKKKNKKKVEEIDPVSKWKQKLYELVINKTD